MSKPELPGGQSLEEILASIRKTLADDRPDEGLSKLDSLQAAAAADLPAPANGGAEQAGDTYQDQLAVALHGTANGHAEEEDLTDLLAAELPAPAQTPKPQPEGADGRDPLWFLSRTNGAADTNPKPAVTREPAEPRAASQPEEIALTRPESLRRSFPPLFGGGDPAPSRPVDVPVERAKPAGAMGSTPARAPDPAAVPTPAAVTTDKPAAASTATASQAAAEAAKPTAAAEARLIPTALAAEPVRAWREPAVEVAAMPVARDIPAPESKAQSNVESKAAPKAEPVAVVAEPAAAETKAQPAAGLQGQPLQEAIARLLEPVIQQWLDTNLPRMVEAAIREEVARQVKGPRAGLKI